MKIKTLKVTIEGPLWRVREFEIENIDVMDLYEEEDGKGVVEVKDFELSNDKVLDVYIYVGSPNGTTYKVSLEGKYDDAGEKKIEFSEKYKVVKNGRLRIIISEHISKITKQ